MPKYLILYKINSATQPADPKVSLKEFEENIAAIDELVKAGIFKEHGVFNAGDGFIIAELPSYEEGLKLSQRFWPGVITEIREFIPWEKAQEIVVSSLKEQIK